MDEREQRLRTAILELVEKRGPGKSICPSEAARAAFPKNWRDQMESCREVAFQLAKHQKIEVCTGGKVIDNQLFKGPIRLRTPSRKS